MKEMTPTDRQQQALHALNCAIACLVSWPPSDEKLGGAVYFAALALHRMAQADPDGSVAKWAKKCLDEARRSNGNVTIEDDHLRSEHNHVPTIALDRPRIVSCSCGWKSLSGTADTEEAFATHIAVLR